MEIEKAITEGRKNKGCPDLDPNWPGIDNKPRGPVLCELYPNCKCGEHDKKITQSKEREE